jgi:hypothetical protein
MTALGAFRDDFYNAASVLPQSGIGAGYTSTAGTLLAASIVGAGDQYVNISGQSTSFNITTDTAANIIATLQNIVATQYKAQITGFGAGVNPPVGVPNLFNLSFTLTLTNNNSAGTVTIVGGTGVTVSGTATIAFTASRTFVVQVTSPTTVTITNAMSGSV